MYMQNREVGYKQMVLQVDTGEDAASFRYIPVFHWGMTVGCMGCFYNTPEL